MPKITLSHYDAITHLNNAHIANTKTIYLYIVLSSFEVVTLQKREMLL